MRKPCSLEPPSFCTSVGFRGLTPEIVLVCTAVRPEIDARGLGLREMGVLYGELQDVGEIPPGENPPGERRPKEFEVVMLAGIDIVDM